MRDLFIGVTTWNSELFLDVCLEAVRRTTRNINVAVGVVDNVSTDRSVEIARKHGARVHIEKCSQAIALNRLLSMSDARHTLLIHSDVVLLSDRWYEVCNSHVANDCALVSPEDIGCGPLTRPYGKGMPESCFLLFDTAKALACRELIWIRRRGLPWPTRRLDFEHYYVTHDLPDILRRHGFAWTAMKVHGSPHDVARRYTPNFTPEYWSDDLSDLKYAMGNFYSLDGVITHYHNWYDRVAKDVPLTSVETTEGEGKGLPLAFLSLGTRRFLEDYAGGALVIPDARELSSEPVEVPRWVPDLRTPFSAGAAVARQG